MLGIVHTLLGLTSPMCPVQRNAKVHADRTYVTQLLACSLAMVILKLACIADSGAKAARDGPCGRQKHIVVQLPPYVPTVSSRSWAGSSTRKGIEHLIGSSAPDRGSCTLGR